MKSCLIFDLDRTLVESTWITHKILEIMKQDHNIDSTGIDDKKVASYTLEEFSKELARLNRLKWEDVMKIYKNVVFDLYKQVEIHGQHVLSSLRIEGHRICIITNNSLLAVDGVLDGLRNKNVRFDIVLGFEDLRKNEDKSDNILRIIKKFGVSYKYYYIGDHKRDIMFAKKAEVTAVGITTGVFSKKELVSEGADYVISSIDEVADIIQG